MLHALRRLALGLPGTEEGIACAGTSLEKRSIKVEGKAFLFLRAADAMFKLRDSLPAAMELAAKRPDRCKVGANGWVTCTLGGGGEPSVKTLGKWINESYRLLAPKLPKASRAGTKERRG